MKSRVDSALMLSKEAQKELADFRVFLKVKDGVAQQTVAAILYAYHLCGFRKKRLQEMYERVLSIINMPPVIGNQIGGNDLIDFLTKEYGIDFDRINLKTETESEYLKRVFKN